MTKLPKGIRQRGDSFMVDVTFHGKRLTATCADLEDAKNKRVELQHQMMNGYRFPDADGGRRWSLGKAVDKCCAIHWAALRSAETATKNIGFAERFFGRDRMLDTIDTNALDEYVADLVRLGNADGTINRKLAALSKCMAFSMERGGLSSKPKFPFRKEYEGRMRFFTDDEEAAIVAAARTHGFDLLADLVPFLCDTGLRRAEALALTAQDLDLEQGVVNVWLTKTNRARSVPLTKRAREIVKRRLHLANYSAETNQRGLLFPVTEAQLRHWWDTIRGRLGFGGDRAFVLHTTRHTCASRLVQRGVPIKVVQEWLGHTTITTTMRYAQLAPHSLMEHVNVLERETI